MVKVKIVDRPVKKELSLKAMSQVDGGGLRHMWALPWTYALYAWIVTAKALGSIPSYNNLLPRAESLALQYKASSDKTTWDQAR